MNIDEAASFLRVTRRALERWIRQGLLGKDVMQGDVFEPAALEAWACGRGMLPEEGPGSISAPVGDLFSRAVERGVVSTDPEANSARGAIESALAGFGFLGEEARERLLLEILERERLMGTSMGHGVSVPHPRKPPEDLVGEQIMSVLYLPEPVDWDAPDGLRVHTVLLQLSPNTKLHLQLLSRISTALRIPGFGQFLATRPEKSLLIERLREIHGPA